MEDSHVDALQELPEVQFAKVLENFQLSGGQVNPLEVVRNFTALSSERALALAQRVDQRDDASALEQDFANWDMETKLWHLVNVLYSFRLADITDSAAVPAFASLPLKLEKHLADNAKLKEIMLIIQWIQFNLPDVAAPENGAEDKWVHTRVAIENKALASLSGRKDDADYVEHLDVDAPLRSQKHVAPQDDSIDSTNFSYIYELLLKGEIQAAVEYATSSGNYTLALILLASAQDYVDPVIDGSDANVLGDVAEPSGLQHKYLWLQTVSKLAQSDNLNANESLIYSFLSGGDQSENIRNAQGNWEVCLLLYLSQLLNHHLRIYMTSILPDTDDALKLVTFPTPQHSSIDSILNTLLKSSQLQVESKNLFRVIMGSVMINQLNFFLHNTFKSVSSDLLEDQQILRVLAHLAVVAVMLNLHEGSRTPTKIITRYISSLSDAGLDDLVPIYLAFIPDEKDVRECYSIFLTSITDSDKRAKQIGIFKKLGIAAPTELDTPNSSTTEDIGDEYENKINNILKRTVERVMLETASHYGTEGDLIVRDQEADSTDVKLYRAVEWFYENKMYEDAIVSTITIFRRFLLTGRLKALKEFGRNKNFRSLLKSYDLELHTRSIGGPNATSSISEDDKEELLQYDKFLECLNLLDEWKSFSTGVNHNHWKSKDVEKSILKTSGKVQDLIFHWFIDNMNSTTDEERKSIYSEYRSIYVPYFIIELLQVLQQSRLHDWKYIRHAFQLINEVADDKQNDFLTCFLACGKLNEFVTLAGEVAVIAAEKGKKGIYT